MIRLMAWACSLSSVISSLSSSETWCTALMLCSEFWTMDAPASALALVSAEALEAAPAFLATSCTVAFISFMAVAASPRRWEVSCAPRSDCSIWAESWVEAELTTCETCSSCEAAWSMASVLARASAPAASAWRMASVAFSDCSRAFSDSRRACSICSLSAWTISTMAAYTPRLALPSSTL